MAHTYHGTTNLIALPNRTVQVYPSGLVRVERSFICRKDMTSKHRTTLAVNQPMPLDDGSPCIDGIYIFPEAQEILRDDGFTEFRVTGYGRVAEFRVENFERSSVQSSYRQVTLETTETETITTNQMVPSINEIYIVRGVLPQSSPSSDALIFPNIKSPNVFPVGEAVSLVGKAVSLKSGETRVGGTLIRTFVEINLDSFTSVNFGQWSEYTVTYAANALVIISEL